MAGSDEQREYEKWLIEQQFLQQLPPENMDESDDYTSVDVYCASYLL